MGVLRAVSAVREAMPELHVVTVSTRPGRHGHRLAQWFADRGREHGRFEVVPVDLQTVGLPLFDEPNHPRLRKYVHPHTVAWSELVDRADAFVFVTPEYNYSAPPSLFNALDYLFHEWAYKPVGFLSYGGLSGGLRGVQHAKSAVTALNMMPVPVTLAVPMFQRHLTEDGRFEPDPTLADTARLLLDELGKWEGALRSLRHPT